MRNVRSGTSPWVELQTKNSPRVTLNAQLDLSFKGKVNIDIEVRSQDAVICAGIIVKIKYYSAWCFRDRAERIVM